MLRMTETKVVGIFDDRYQATMALDELRQAGFREEDLSFAIRGAEAVRGGMITDALMTRDAAGAVRGMAVGALVGVMIAALASVLISGGPFTDMGVVASLIGFAIAGFAIGAIFGAMAGLAMSEREARMYAREYAAGRAVLSVGGGDLLEARLILRRHGARNLSRHIAAMHRPIHTA